eukprot:2660984-Amphidinium_carterae.2
MVLQPLHAITALAAISCSMRQLINNNDKYNSHSTKTRIQHTNTRIPHVANTGSTRYTRSISSYDMDPHRTVKQTSSCSADWLDIPSVLEDPLTTELAISSTCSSGNSELYSKTTTTCSPSTSSWTSTSTCIIGLACPCTTSKPVQCIVTHVVPVEIHIPHNVMRPDLWDGSFEFLRTMESRPLIENTMTERLLQSVENVTAINNDEQMWVASPPTSSQIPIMSEVRRLTIMGSTIDDAITTALAMNLAPPGRAAVKLTPAGSSNRPTLASRQEQEMPPPPVPVAQRRMPKLPTKGSSKESEL